jgi:glycosyltransferase involved in cell wall biosynthesis
MKLVSYRNSRIVWHYHNPTERTLKQRIKDAFKIRLAFNRLGDYCIAVGDGVHESVRAAGANPPKTVLLYNAVNAARFLNKCDVTPEARRELGVSIEDTVFLTLGWDPMRKGMDIFFSAAEELYRRNHKNCRFLVIGRTTTRLFVSNLLSQSHMSDTAFQVIDPVEDLSCLLRGVDVFVSASRSEGLTYAVLESMTAGKVVLSSDIPAVRETYGRSKGVWLFPSEDWKLLADLMEKVVLLRSDERRSLGQANSRYVVENHSLDLWSEKVGQLYRELIGRRAHC